MKNHRRSHGSQGHMIDSAALESLRRGEGRQLIFAQLYERCLVWARRSGRLQPGDREEIVVAALAEALPVILNPEVNASAVDLAIRASLRGSKLELLRQIRMQMEPEGEFANQASDFGEPAERIEMEHLLAITRAAGGFISIAIDLLSDRDHDHLVDAYKLTQAGLRLRCARPPAFQDPEAVAIATRLALKRFSRNLEAVCAAAQSALALDAGLLDEALRLVRGEAVSALSLIQALAG
jgi:hypothetical protein